MIPSGFHVFSLVAVEVVEVVVLVSLWDEVEVGVWVPLSSVVVVVGVIEVEVCSLWGVVPSEVVVMESPLDVPVFPFSWGVWLPMHPLVSRIRMRTAIKMFLFTR